MAMSADPGVFGPLLPPPPSPDAAPTCSSIQSAVTSVFSFENTPADGFGLSAVANHAHIILRGDLGSSATNIQGRTTGNKTATDTRRLRAPRSDDV